MARCGIIKRRGGADASRHDEGVTFVEILVSVVLLGTAGIAVIVGMAAALRGSSTHDSVATLQANLSDAADVLTDVTYDDATMSDPVYVSCGGAAAAYTTEISPWQVTIASVEFWDGAAWTGVGGCVGGEMQKITLEASNDGLERRLVVVKREASVAITPGGAWNDDIVIPVPNPGL